MVIEAQVVDRVLEEAVSAVPIKLGHDQKSVYQLMRRARGEELANYKGDKTPIWKELAGALRRLHSIKGVGAGLIVDTDGQLKGAFDSWRDYCWASLEDNLHYAESHELLGSQKDLISWFVTCEFPLGLTDLSLLHGDLNDWNLFVQDGHLTDIIDWEDTMLGDPVFDLASWACFTSHSEDDWAILFDQYYRDGNRPKDFWRRFWIYYLRIVLSRMVNLHKHGFTSLDKAKNRITVALQNLNSL